MIPISVIMPTYNTPISILKEAIDSILSQTFADFEFIIIDDASSDESVDYLNSLTDPRIILIRNSENLGVTKSLNVGLRRANGRYIARMDGDDIAMPDRLEKQIGYMENHPEVIVCGTNFMIFHSNMPDESLKVYRTVMDMDFLQICLLFENCGLLHPSVMFNTELLRKNNLYYDESLINAQDYGMWVKCARVADIQIIPDILMKYRVHRGQISNKGRTVQSHCAEIIRNREVNLLMGTNGIDYSAAHEKCVSDAFPDASDILWLKKLLNANHISQRYNEEKFKKVIYEKMSEKAQKILISCRLQKNYLLFFKAFFSMSWCSKYLFIWENIKKINRKLFRRYCKKMPIPRRKHKK